MEREVDTYYGDVRRAVSDDMEHTRQASGKDGEVVRTLRRIIDERDSTISELKNASKALKLDYENEKRRVHEKVSRLVSEIDFMEKTRAKKEAIEGYDLKAMHLKIDELQNKLEVCKHKNHAPENTTGLAKTLETISGKLDTLVRPDSRHHTTHTGEKLLEAN